MRTCIFCPNTNLELEHVWPAWISKFLLGAPKKNRLKVTRWAGSEDAPSAGHYNAPELNHKARIVCYDCNHGWMSDIESTASDVLKPMLLGYAVTLGEFSQMTITAWLTLRAMIFEYAVAGPDAEHFHTVEERRRFADIERDGSLQPAPGVYWWLFQHRSRRWLARSSVANLSLHATPSAAPHHTQVITAHVGRFGFQMFASRWPEGRWLELNSRPILEWGGATSLLWPHSTRRLSWPSDGGYLADDTLKPFVDRFNGGITLNRLSKRRS